MSCIPRTYNNRALVGNWYEDRLTTPRKQLSEDQKREISQTVRQDKWVRGNEPDTFRTQTVDFANSPTEPYTAADTMRTAKTTKIEMEARLSEVLRPQQKPKMINCENLKQAMQTERVLPGPSRGFGSVLPRHRETYNNLYTTSNKHFYEDMVTKAKTESPHAFARSEAKSSAGTLYRDAHTFERSPQVPSGRAGARGEITRHPGLSGSVYGMSVWVDEYCKWGTKLDGWKREDSSAKRCTPYLDA